MEVDTKYMSQIADLRQFIYRYCEYNIERVQKIEGMPAEIRDSGIASLKKALVQLHNLNDKDFAIYAANFVQAIANGESMFVKQSGYNNKPAEEQIITGPRSEVVQQISEDVDLQACFDDLNLSENGSIEYIPAAEKYTTIGLPGIRREFKATEKTNILRTMLLDPMIANNAHIIEGSLNIYKIGSYKVERFQCGHIAVQLCLYSEEVLNTHARPQTISYSEFNAIMPSDIDPKEIFIM